MVGPVRRLRLFLTILLAAFLIPPPLAAEVYRPAFYRLANGLQIIIVPNHRAPVVHHMLWYRVGAVDEEAGKSGLAHYLEHLMFKGTPSIPPGAYSKIIALQGGDDNAFTSHDATAYFATVPAAFLPNLMAMEADRMGNLLLTDVLARPERDVVLAERRQRTDDDPHGRFAEKIEHAVFGNYPYGRPVIGWRKEVERMDSAAATAFYKKWYAPNNAVLVVSGDVMPEKVVALAAATYGRVAFRSLPPRKNLSRTLPRRGEEKIITVHDGDVQQPLLNRIFTAPSYHLAKERQAYALEVLEEILDGGAVGRLYKGLVVRDKVATGIDVSYSPSMRGWSEFRILVALSPGVNHKKAGAALQRLLNELNEKGVTQNEVSKAIERLQRQAIFSRDSLRAPGYAFGLALSSGGGLDEVENWPKRIGAVTLDDVNNAARELLRQAGVTGYLLPEPGAKGSRPVSSPSLGGEQIR